MEKVFTAFDKIPGTVLSDFPAYDPEVYLWLRNFYKKVRAKILETNKKSQLVNSQEHESDRYLKDKQALKDLNDSFQDFHKNVEHTSRDVTLLSHWQSTSTAIFNNNLQQHPTDDNSPSRNEEIHNFNAKRNDSLESHNSSFKEKNSQSNNMSPQSSPMQAQKKASFNWKYR